MWRDFTTDKPSQCDEAIWVSYHDESRLDDENITWPTRPDQNDNTAAAERKDIDSNSLIYSHLYFKIWVLGFSLNLGAETNHLQYPRLASAAHVFFRKCRNVGLDIIVINVMLLLGISAQWLKIIIQSVAGSCRRLFWAHAPDPRDE